MLEDLEGFVTDHRAHGQLVGEASELGPGGYRVMVTCPCGVVFERGSPSSTPRPTSCVSSFE